MKSLDMQNITKKMNALRARNVLIRIPHGLLDDRSIALYAEQGMIRPFVDHQVRLAHRQLNSHSQVSVEKVLSYGLSSYGYDVRLDRQFRVFSNTMSTIIDPKNFDEKCLVDFEGNRCIIPPNSYILGRTMETFCMPPDVMCICVGKSSYARCGAYVNVTPIEPGFEGTITLEIGNSTPLPLVVYAEEGIAQLIFFKGYRPLTTYADRKGKYQNQVDVTTVRI